MYGRHRAILRGVPGFREWKRKWTLQGVYLGSIGYISGLYMENGKENGNYNDKVIKDLGFGFREWTREWKLQ